MKLTGAAILVFRASKSLAGGPGLAVPFGVEGRGVGMREVVAEALVARALLLTAPGQGMADPSPRIAALLDGPALSGLTAHDVLLAVVAIGRAVLPRWVERFPQLGGPVAAVAAAETWVAAPTAEAAESALRASEAAIQQAIAQWPGQLRHAAWAGRTAAWGVLRQRSVLSNNNDVSDSGSGSSWFAGCIQLPK